ncbi:cadherin-13 isoform X3 [Conger conger]|uniref:cadherin-13 isoform X3 n=1 Tax=Conger conger TaxID=82655 RepID=UPI002A59BFCF|nr:cadherin-13 isoform X3 [Conger conger]
MDIGTRVLLAFLVCQVACAGAEEKEEGPCVPGFQVKEYQVEYSGGFQKGVPLLQVHFDDCAGNEGVTFEVSHPGLVVDGDRKLVPRGDVENGTVVLIHGRSAHAHDTARLHITNATPRSAESLREILGLGQALNRTKRSLLVPPMYVPENQRAPFPKSIGKLQVSTTDPSGKTVEGPVQLDVSVIDQNDNRPIFSETRYAGEVLEGSATGTTVMTMTASDADDPNTENAVLRYIIVKQSPDKPSPNMFYIDPEKGDIVTVISPKLLDRETLPTTQYELEIVAKDMAGSDVGLTGTATATVTITDKNDHAPEFTHSLFQASVQEGWTGVVLNLTVDDRDDPATGAWRAAYSIINGNTGHSFEVHTNPDNNEGMLYVVKPLDYESTAFHTLLIKVENEDPLVPDVGYGPSSTATVHVQVLDVNEGPVFFPDPMMVTKRENVPLGSLVATLNATDPDLLQIQSVRYAVLKDPANWLVVNPVSGTVNTTAILDRESPFVHENRYSAVFMATDNGSPPATGTGTLIITLEDDNDNAPSVYPTVARVCEDAKDLSVVMVGGQDKDISPNAAPFRIELGKQPGLEKMWKVTKVNNTHSQVTLLHSLQRANYNLPLLVTDSGMPPLSNSTDIKVQVCTCKKSKMDCSAADSTRSSLVLLCLLLLSLLFLYLE